MVLLPEELQPSILSGVIYRTDNFSQQLLSKTLINTTTYKLFSWKTLKKVYLFNHSNCSHPSLEVVVYLFLSLKGWQSSILWSILCRFHSLYHCCHSLSLIAICCHSLSLVVSLVVTLSLVVPLVVTRYHSLSLVVPLVVTRCHLLSLVVPLVVTCCHSLSFVVTCWTTCCHSLSLVVPLIVTRCHSLSLVVPLVVNRCHSFSFVVTRCTTRQPFLKVSYVSYFSFKFPFFRFSCFHLFCVLYLV